MARPATSSRPAARGLPTLLGAGGLLAAGLAWGWPAPAAAPAEVPAVVAPALSEARMVIPAAVASAPAVEVQPAAPAAEEVDLERDHAHEGGHDHAGELHPDDGCGATDDDGLLEALAGDPAALSAALDRLRAGRDPLEVEALAAALGRLRDPRVVSAALDVVASSSEPWRRVLALEVLDGLEAGAAGPAALRALSDPSPEVRRAAVHAIPPPSAVDPKRRPTVLAALRRVLQTDEDVEARRRATVAAGEWAATAVEAAPLLDALASDPAPEVRAGAAFALELARLDDPAVRAALLPSVVEDEDDLVRENALRALEALGVRSDAEVAAAARARRELGLD